jgi:hypothetical protein
MAAVGPQLRLLLQSGEDQTINANLTDELTILWVCGVSGGKAACYLWLGWRMGAQRESVGGCRWLSLDFPICTACLHLLTYTACCIVASAPLPPHPALQMSAQQGLPYSDLANKDSVRTPCRS